MTRRSMNLLSQLKHYDVIGFDLDNTLARYNLNNMLPMIYNAQVQYLVNQKGYSRALLERFAANQDFMMRGLVFDLNRGNLLKLNCNGEISIATHGTTLMTENEIKEQYPHSKPGFHNQLLNNYNSSGTFRIFENSFDIPSAILCALMVDDFDSQTHAENNEDQLSSGYNAIWKDVLSSLYHIFDYKNFGQRTNTFFPTIENDPSAYIDKVDDAVVELLRKLKKEGKILYILTSSYADYSEFVLNHIFGSSEWNELFDLVLYFARKPAYFIEDSPYYIVQDQKVGQEHSTLSSGKYSHGNHKILDEYLRKRLTIENPKVVYFGDSVRSDIFPVGNYTDWTPWCVVEEGLDTNGDSESPKCSKMCAPYLSPYSCPWGSFYRCNGDTDSLWYSVVRKFSPHPIIQQLVELTT